jgi:heme exporter protein D
MRPGSLSRLHLPEIIMQWSSLSEFISMGGYGVYVWGSYGVTLVLLAAEVLMLRARKRRLAVRAELETGRPKLETVS